MNAYNSFDHPNEITVMDFTSYTLNNDQIEIDMPPHSVVTLELDGNLMAEDHSIKLKNPDQGLNYKVYDGNWYNLPDFSTLEPVQSGIVSGIRLPQDKARNYGLVYDGFIKIEQTGLYTFTLASDDGSKLTIAGNDVANNDGRHAVKEQEGLLFLHKGYYPFQLEYFQAGGGSTLELYIQRLGESEKQLASDQVFWREK